MLCYYTLRTHKELFVCKHVSKHKGLLTIMIFIPFDDYQSMILFGMPITLVESGDEWAKMDNFLPDV